MKTILVVNVNWLGDAVFSSPVFYALKQKYPECRIVCLADPRIHPVLKRIDAIDTVIEYDEKNKHKGLFGKLEVIQQIRSERCDEAYFIHESSTKALMVALAGIKVRIGCPSKKKQRFLTHQYAVSESTLHRSERYLQVVKKHGVDVSQAVAKLEADQEGVARIKDMLRTQGVQDSDRLIGFNIGANWELKRWPVTNFRKLIQQLNGANQKIIITGAKKDQNDIAEMLKGINSANVINIAAQTNLDDLISLLSVLDVFVCADSGPLHIANSLGTSVVGIYGPTRPEATGPVGVGRSRVLQMDVGCNRHPCYFEQCPDNICMQAVTVHDVVKAVEQITNDRD